METLAVEISVRDHVRGSAQAPLRLVEYGDYEHPRCGQAYHSVKRIQAELGEDICFVFRHFPRTEPQLNALCAAFAAEAAGMQGKFWEMHEKLYAHQDALEEQEFINYAADIGLKMEQFISDMASIDVRLKVRRDVESGMHSGVETTPVFYINDRLLRINDNIHNHSNILTVFKRSLQAGPRQLATAM